MNQVTAIDTNNFAVMAQAMGMNAESSQNTIIKIRYVMPQ